MSLYIDLLKITSQAKQDIKEGILADTYKSMLEDVYGESVTEALIALRKANAEVAEFLDEHLEQQHMDLSDEIAEDLAMEQLHNIIDSIVRTI